MLHRLAMGLLLAALVIASPASARGDAGGPNDATVPIQISLRVGEQPYVFGGEGICQHAADASIYEAPALLWSARHSEARRSLNLSFWRLQKGGDMMTLSLDLGDASHRVNTVKVGDQGVLQGSGRTTFTAGGQGGTFTIEAAAKDGTRISGTISCGRFTPIVEEGGG